MFLNAFNTALVMLIVNKKAVIAALADAAVLPVVTLALVAKADSGGIEALTFPSLSIFPFPNMEDAKAHANVGIDIALKVQLLSSAVLQKSSTSQIA